MKRPNEENPKVTLHFARLSALDEELSIDFSDRIDELHMPNGEFDYLIQRIEWSKDSSNIFAAVTSRNRVCVKIILK